MPNGRYACIDQEDVIVNLIVIDLAVADAFIQQLIQEFNYSAVVRYDQLPREQHPIVGGTYEGGIFIPPPTPAPPPPTLEERIAALEPRPIVLPESGPTISLDLTLGDTFQWAATRTQTVNAIGVQRPTQKITCIVVNDSLLPRQVTFGLGFRAASALLGSLSRTATIQFISDGTNLLEISRATAII